ncbi:MAG: ankyrin repeat domain-containing protein [Planctomycetota bacterium]
MNDSAGNELRFFDVAVSVNCALGDEHHQKHLGEAKAILSSDAAIGESTLAGACISGNVAAVQRLLDSGESVDAQTGPGNWSPLVYCCFSRFLRDGETSAGVVDTARLLLERGADANSYFMHDGNRECCLYGACGVANHPGMAELLLSHGADPNDGETAYHVAEFEQHECIRVLLKHGMNASSKATVLLRKLDFEDIEGVRLILDLGVDPNEPGIWAKSALHQAIMRGRSVEMIQLLIDRGADVNQLRGDGVSALQLAADADRPEVLEILRTSGATG